MDKIKGYSISEVAHKLDVARATIRGVLAGLGIEPQPGYSKAGRLALVITAAEYAKVKAALYNRT